jgi:hypothetical protein
MLAGKLSDFPQLIAEAEMLPKADLIFRATELTPPYRRCGVEKVG